MVIFKSQSEHDANFQDQIIIDSYPISELNSNIFINLTHTFLTKEGIIKTENKSVEIYDDYIESVDLDFLDKEYVLVDPTWEECPADFDLYNMETWPEGMVYPDIPKIIDPTFVERTKYFSRLYSLIIASTSEDQMKQKIFEFISVEEPQFFEPIVGQDNANSWNAVVLEVSEMDKDLETLKQHKIQILKSMVSSRLLKKFNLIKQLNIMSDSYYSVKTVCGYLGKAESDIVLAVTNKIGASNNISDLNNVNVETFDFTDVLADLPAEYAEFKDNAEASLYNVAHSILGHRKIAAMRQWCTDKENEIIGSTTTEDVVRIMHEIFVPEV